MKGYLPPEEYSDFLHLFEAVEGHHYERTRQFARDLLMKLDSNLAAEVLKENASLSEILKAISSKVP